MRFIKARQIRVGDVVLFSEDPVADLHAHVGAITKKNQELVFAFLFKSGDDKTADSIRCSPDERCLLIRRPGKRRPVDDDARDPINTSVFLNRLSDQALAQITQLKLKDIRDRLGYGDRPFSRLTKKTREKLLHVPTRWVRKGADWLLEARKIVTEI